jgi:hypothetical protein
MQMQIRKPLKQVLIIKGDEEGILFEYNNFERAFTLSLFDNKCKWEK